MTTPQGANHCHKSMTSGKNYYGSLRETKTFHIFQGLLSKLNSLHRIALSCRLISGNSLFSSVPISRGIIFGDTHIKLDGMNAVQNLNEHIEFCSPFYQFWYWLHLWIHWNTRFWYWNTEYWNCIEKMNIVSKMILFELNGQQNN